MSHFPWVTRSSVRFMSTWFYFCMVFYIFSLRTIFILNSRYNHCFNASCWKKLKVKKSDLQPSFLPYQFVRSRHISTVSQFFLFSKVKCSLLGRQEKHIFHPVIITENLNTIGGVFPVVLAKFAGGFSAKFNVMTSNVRAVFVIINNNLSDTLPCFE